MYNVNMENRKLLKETKKELLQHYLNGRESFKGLSRLERYEYAYEAMRLVRNYSCLKNGINPDKVDLSFETYRDKAVGKANLYYDKDTDSERGLFTISTGVPLKTFMPASSIYRVAFHEMKHITDYFNSNKKNLTESKNSYRPLIKAKSRELTKIQRNLAYNYTNSYKNGGVAWYAKNAEIRADKTSFKETLGLKAQAILKSDKKVAPLKEFGKELVAGVKNMTKHVLARRVMPYFNIASRYVRFNYDKKENNTPNSNPSSVGQNTNVNNDKYSRQLISIQSVRNAAGKNPQLFNQKDYLSNIVGREVNTPKDMKESDEPFKEVLINQNIQAIQEARNEELSLNQTEEASQPLDVNINDARPSIVSAIVDGIRQTNADMQALKNEIQTNPTQENINESTPIVAITESTIATVAPSMEE